MRFNILFIGIQTSSVCDISPSLVWDKTLIAQGGQPIQSRVPHAANSELLFSLECCLGMLNAYNMPWQITCLTHSYYTFLPVLQWADGLGHPPRRPSLLKSVNFSGRSIPFWASAWNDLYMMLNNCHQHCAFTHCCSTWIQYTKKRFPFWIIGALL